MPALRVLLGRAAECARIERLLDDARAGVSRSLLITGEPGIGKSALLDYAAEHAHGMRVLRTLGVESESELPFSALHELLLPGLDLVAALPEVQAHALRTALALGPPGPIDRFAVYAATLGILAAIAEDSPLLCLIDDAHWLDDSSADALVFSGRRLEAEGIGLLFAARESETSRFDAPGLPALHLTGLDHTSAIELLNSSVDPRVGERLIQITGGNPLALLEMPSALTAEQLSGHDLVEEPLPVGVRVERAFLGRTLIVSAAARTGLLVAALNATGHLDVIGRAMLSLGAQPAALEEAEAAGLIALDGGRLLFLHPLVRSAICQAARPAERRAAHFALSQSLGDGSHAAEAVWHLAAASVGPEEHVAESLEAAAAEARGRGGHAAAARALAEAAKLTPQGDRRAGRLLAAGGDAWFAGRSERARTLLVDALAQASDPMIRADAHQLLGRTEMWGGSVIDGRRRLLAEAERVQPLDATRAAQMMAEAAGACLMTGELDRALEISREAVRLSEPEGRATSLFAQIMFAFALIDLGDADAGGPILARIQPLVSSSAIALLNGALGLASFRIERFDIARDVLQEAIHSARSQGAVDALPYLLAVLSELDYRTGRWAAANAGGHESLSLAIETGQESEVGFSLVTLARLEAAQGRVRECREHVEIALGIAERSGASSLLTFGSAVLGLLELSMGAADEAIPHLEWTRSLARRQGLVEPSTIQWAPDLIEALARANRREDTSDPLAEFQEQARNTGRTWALAAAARCRGLLASDDSYEACFEESLSWHEQTPTPFELARTQLCYGERLRRAKRKVLAREQLHIALRTFGDLGATPWAERARSELRATGETLRRRLEPASGELTPQELQVALVVAQGATNREAAAALFLSRKTIEFHLGNVYRKLGLRSRSELARHFATEVGSNVARSG